MALPPPRNSLSKGPPPRPSIRREQPVPEDAEAFIEQVTKQHSEVGFAHPELFKVESDEENLKRVYTTKILAPVYKPRGRAPSILTLVDKNVASKLFCEIEDSNVTPEEKDFLFEAAKRHNVFNYESIADYYANATPEMQRLMEKSALVIIDFEDALKLGFVSYTKEIAKLYEREHEGA